MRIRRLYREQSAVRPGSPFPESRSKPLRLGDCFETAWTALEEVGNWPSLLPQDSTHRSDGFVEWLRSTNNPTQASSAWLARLVAEEQL